MERLGQIKEYARLRAAGVSTVNLRLALLEQHHQQLQKQISGLQTHLKALQTKIEIYRNMLANEDSEQAGKI